MTFIMFNFEQYADKCALIDDDGHSISYRELFDKNSRLLDNFDKSKKALYFICVQIV